MKIQGLTQAPKDRDTLQTYGDWRLAANKSSTKTSLIRNKIHLMPVLVPLAFCFSQLCLNSSESFKGTKKLTKTMSRVLIQGRDQNQTIDVYKYCEFVNKFLCKNRDQIGQSDLKDIAGVAEEMLQLQVDSTLLLKRLGEKLGFCTKDGRTYLDISYPVILQFAKNVINQPQEHEYLEPKKQQCNLENLRVLINEFGDLAFNPNDSRKSNLTVEQKRRLLGIIFENDQNRLFNLQNLSDQKEKSAFTKIVDKILDSSTGFQRIMSLLLLSTLNRDEKNAFLFGRTSIDILRTSQTTVQKDIARKTSTKLRIYLDFNDLTSSTVLHEITHSFHWMLYNSDALFSQIYNYNIVNAKNGDFVQIFYPMLVEEKAIHIRQAVHKNLPTLRRSADFNNKILKICCLLIKNGFGSVIFNEITDEEMLNIDNIVTNDELLSKIIATHISVHFASTPSGAAVQKYRTYWSNAEEMLTIVGLLPFVIDYSNSEQSGQFRQFIFEDRQNELIYLMREGASSMVHMFKSEQDLQEIFYRRHCFDVNGFMRSSDTDTALEEEVNNTLKRSFDLHQSNKMIVLTKQAFSKPPYLLHNSIDSQNNGLVTNVSSAESDNPTRTCIEFLKGALRKQALVPKGQYLIVKNGENVLEADGQILSNAQILSNIQRFGDNRIDNVDAVQAHAALVNGDLLTFRAVLANNSSRMDTLLNSEVPFDQDVIKLHARIKSWEYWREVLAVADCSSNLDVWEHIGSFSYEDLDLAKRMLQDERVPQAFVLAAFLRMIILQLAKGNLQNLMFLGSAVCDTPIDPQVKANALRLLGTSDICNNEKERFLDYLLISLNNKVPLDNAGIKGLLDRLLQFYPFHYNTSVMGVWYDNCAKLMRQRSLLDYLPSEIRESCIQLMNMDCSLEDTITLIKQNITGNAFDGFTLLHYAASLPNTVFLQQLLAALSAEVTCTSNNNIYQNIADILVATGSEETDNQTALDIAITFCKEDSLRVLCEICALVLRQLDPGKRQQFYDRTIRRALDRISPYSRSIIENVVQAPSEEVTTDLNP